VHPLEGFALDVLGPLITYQALGLTPRERTVLFVASTIKTVNDHSGYMFPWDPVVLLGKVTGSDIIYHSIHHQPWGIKVILKCVPLRRLKV
jgi:sphinganine C4-monooxygenase